MVSGYAWNGTVKPWLAGHWDALVQPMIDLGYRWAVVLGNHDDQVKFKISKISKI